MESWETFQKNLEESWDDGFQRVIQESGRNVKVEKCVDRVEELFKYALDEEENVENNFENNLEDENVDQYLEH